MVMLVSIMALYFLGGSQTFDLPQLTAHVSAGLFSGRTTVDILLFLGFFLAFGIKAPVFPFHSWVPDAYAEATTGGTIILVALKMGLYGFIRFCLPLFPFAVKACAPVIITLAVIGVIYAALVAAMQKDLKRLIAYSSISHIGVIMLGIFALTSIGMDGAVVQMVSHTLTTGALFIVLGALYARRQSYRIADYGGLMGVMPMFTVVFLIATLSSVALPLTSGFAGELLLLAGLVPDAPLGGKLRHHGGDLVGGLYAMDVPAGDARQNHARREPPPAGFDLRRKVGAVPAGRADFRRRHCTDGHHPEQN